MAPIEDPLLLLRHSIASGGKIIPTTSADSSEEAPLSKATHLVFTDPARVAVPIDAPTRFTSTEGKAVDVRSIYFAWLNRDFAIPEYNAVATKLNEEMTGAAAVHMFAFVERLVLFTYLEGAQEESEFIKPLAGDKDAAAGADAAAPGAASKAAPAASGRAGRGTLDPRLAEIYSGERRMGDRNTVLRGIKPTVSLSGAVSVPDDSDLMILSPRISPTSANSLRPSCLANLGGALRLASAPTRRSRLTRSRPAGPTPLSFSRPRPQHSSACPMPSPSSRVAGTHRQTMARRRLCCTCRG